VHQMAHPMTVKTRNLLMAILAQAGGERDGMTEQRDEPAEQGPASPAGANQASARSRSLWGERTVLADNEINQWPATEYRWR